jgi:large subunit ribosomal protein L17
MRHRLKGSKLGRTASHKKATLRSLSIALLTHHRVVTTLTKAKELRRHVEPVITRSKEDTTHNRREVFSFIHDNKTVSKLFDEIGPLVADRPGGYTRIVKIGARTGDSAEMAVIELVDYNESEAEGTTKKKKRTRRAGKATTTAKASDDTAAAKPTKEDNKADAVVAEELEVVAEAEVVEAEVVEETTEDAKADVTPEAPETETEEGPKAETPSEDSEDKKEDNK